MLAFDMFVNVIVSRIKSVVRPSEEPWVHHRLHAYP